MNGEIDPESADGGDKGGGIATGAAGDAIRFIGILKKGRALRPVTAQARGVVGEVALLGLIELAEGPEHVGFGGVDVGFREIEQ